MPAIGSLSPPTLPIHGTTVDNRERYLAQRLRYDVQYYDSYVWGAEDLDAYGDWTYANDYGWIWRPHTVINNYNNWAPYRYGYWTWCAPYGWTWVGHEPWGWAPYHYGRWVYYNNYWAWCPRSQYYRHRSWWRPALVAFSISFGDNICWYPLHYHQRDPRSRYYRNYHGNSDRLRPMRADELSSLRRVNPAYYRAVTAVSARDFGAEDGRMRRADDVLARRAVSTEPLRTDLPIRPAYALSERTTSGNRAERVTVARPASVRPQRELPQRSTGAAVRSPGVALDNELRRSRILNGREARPEIPTPTSGVSGAVETRPTGAVARPARPLRESEPRIDGGRDRQRSTSDAPATIERPARPIRTSAEDIRPRPEGNDRERVPRSNDAEAPGDHPVRPERTERPEKPRDQIDRPARPETVEPRIERPERRERTEAPTRNVEPTPPV